MNPIYLEIHYKDTKRAISEHISKYNDKLLEDCPGDYKRLKIKSPVESTVYAILDMYAKFLQNNRNRKLQEPVFKINNQAVCTKLGGRISKVTVWRHIKRATDCGIFNKEAYVFHGTNSSYEIGFNPAVLVACFHPEFTELVVSNFQKSVNNIEIPVEKHAELVAIRPRFSDALNGYMISFCNHIVPVKILQEQNINMEVAVDVENVSLPAVDSNINESQKSEVSDFTGNILQEQASIKEAKKDIVPPPLRRQAGVERLEQKFRAEKSEKARQKPDIDLVIFYVEAALKLVLRVLYKDRYVSEYDKEIAKKYIWNYFTNPADPTKKMYDLSTDFTIVILEAYKAQIRKAWIVLPLYKYFDPYEKVGFYRSLSHVENIVKPYIQKNEDYSKSISEVVKIYLNYRKTPNSFENYRKATQFLGKKKNKTYLNFFNSCVEDPEQFNSKNLYNQWNQSINQTQKPT